MSLALQPLSAGHSTEFSQGNHSKTIQPREINLTLLDSLGSCESIYVYFKPKNWWKHELNHFKDNRNTILNQFSSLTSDNKMARETKIQSF